MPEGLKGRSLPSLAPEEKMMMLCFHDRKNE
jgi:hypothetical protein